MQEFWATATVHHHSIRFKMNNKKPIVNLVYFREIFQICPKLPDQQFEELPFEEEILTFLRDLGHSEEIKEDFVYQVENKNVKRSNEMYYPRFTKVISRHNDTQLYGAILLDELTNKAIKDFESYKEYYVIALGAEPPKTKASVKKKQAGSDKTKTHPTSKGKRLKTSAKAAKPANKKQPAKTSKAKGLTVLSDVALTKAEQMKLATKRSLIQTYSSHISGSSTDEGTGGTPGVPDVPTYESDDKQVSWKSSDEENDDDDNDDDEANDDDENNDDDDDDDENDDVDDDADNQDDEGQDDDNEKIDSDKDGDEFVHPKFSTHDQEEGQDEEDDEEEGSDLRKNEEDEVNELYRDVNINLEGRDTKMTDAPQTHDQ
ncbi:hypothetical protein Tco_0750691, partial [Tanacetum coccineum]